MTEGGGKDEGCSALWPGRCKAARRRRCAVVGHTLLALMIVILPGGFILQVFRLGGRGTGEGRPRVCSVRQPEAAVPP